jgi:hypothetical protein
MTRDEALKAAALRAGLIDNDWLKLVDTSKITLEEGKYGVTVKGADELMVKLKEDKPYLFRKHFRDMSETERAAFWLEVKRGPPPKPMPTDKRAADMSETERNAFLKECERRFG